MSKDQEQSSTASRDIVGIDQLTNLSEDRFGNIRSSYSGVADSAKADSAPDSNLNILNVRIFF